MILYIHTMYRLFRVDLSIIDKQSVLYSQHFLFSTVVVLPYIPNQLIDNTSHGWETLVSGDSSPSGLL